MFQQIVVATDGSEYAERAVALALSLAKSLRARVTAVTVTDIMPTGPYTPIPWPSNIERYEVAAAAAARKILDRVLKAARSVGVACETHHVADQPPAEAILAICEQKGCDLIVMGSHGRRGLARLMLGSQVNEVLALSRTSVLVCH